MHGRVEEKRLAEVCQFDDDLNDPHMYIRTVFSNSTFYSLRLKAFDHIDDDDSGYISKEVSSSVSDRIQVSQIISLAHAYCDTLPHFFRTLSNCWGKMYHLLESRSSSKRLTWMVMV